jgi:FkbM family methyltransferase
MLRATYIGNGRMLVAPAWGGKMVAPSDDLSLMPDLAIQGAFDIGLTNFIIANVQTGMTVVDVGANIGYITILLGHRVGSEGKAIAYECSPKNFEFLEENIKMNYIPQVGLYQLAVSDTTGDIISFYEPTRFRGSGSTKSEIVDAFKVLAPFDELKKIEVSTVSLDYHLKDTGFIHFMKIDIEGGEYKAFLGMKELIENNKVGMVAFEMNSSALMDELEPMLNLMKEYRDKGARFFIINLEGILIEQELEHLFSQVHVDNIVVKFV